MNLQISMMCLEENPQFVVPEDGIYLVKTKTDTLKRVHYFSCVVSRNKDAKSGLWKNKFTCNNQKVLAVSIRPLSACN